MSGKRKLADTATGGLRFERAARMPATFCFPFLPFFFGVLFLLSFLATVSVGFT